jgi:hypothetical protein
MAAMSRADIAGDQRTPFYLYVDEFQNFATDSFATILSEARKYGLNLTVANQYTAQMLPEVKDAVFGNVGSIIAFRTSADDARVMLKYFEPKFEEHDIVHMHNRHFAISMTIGGEKVPAFSAISLNLPAFQQDYSQQIIDHSRALYAQSREYIERYVAERYLTEENAAAKQTEPRMTKPRQEARLQSVQPGGSATPAPAPAQPSAPAARPQQPTPSPTASAELPAVVTEATPPSTDEEVKPKRKRTRKRKKKTGDGPSTGPSTAQVARAIEEGVIHLH